MSTLQIPPPDPIEQALDELALLAAAYKANRDASRPVTILRRAMLDACKDVLAELPPGPLTYYPPRAPFVAPAPFDPCAECERNGGICGNTACPKRIEVTCKH